MGKKAERKKLQSFCGGHTSRVGYAGRVFNRTHFKLTHRITACFLDPHGSKGQYSVPANGELSRLSYNARVHIVFIAFICLCLVSFFTDMGEISNCYDLTTKSSVHDLFGKVTEPFSKISGCIEHILNVISSNASDYTALKYGLTSKERTQKVTIFKLSGEQFHSMYLWKMFQISCSHNTITHILLVVYMVIASITMYSTEKKSLNCIVI